jgi:hypothetical protein
VGVAQVIVGVVGVLVLDDPPHPANVKIANDARRLANLKRIVEVLLDRLWVERMAGPTRNPERKPKDFA